VCCLGSTRAIRIFWHGKPFGFSLVLRTRGKDQRQSAQSAVKISSPFFTLPKSHQQKKITADHADLRRLKNIPSLPL
jgi:hypothetical protein